MKKKYASTPRPTARPAPRKERPKSPGHPPEHLTNEQKRHLRALGHPLTSLVQIGKDGITDGVLNGIREALIDHELIKVKLNTNCEMDKEDAALELPKRSGAALVQRVGRTFLLYAPHPTDPTIVLPSD